MINIEDMLSIEFYKLKKIYEGPIQLQKDVAGAYNSTKVKSSKGLDEKKPLDEVIAKINEKYKGAITDADRKLTNIAKTSDSQIFAESIFPKAFNKVAQDSYMESQGTYHLFLKTSACMISLWELWHRLYIGRCERNDTRSP